MFALLLVLTLNGSILSQTEKPPELGPSNHPYHQMIYLTSQRKWSAADSMLDLAIHHYQNLDRLDSVLICSLQRAQILGLSGFPEERRNLVLDLASDIARMQLPHLDVFYQFLRAEIAFDDQAYVMADSLYDLALAFGDSNLGHCHEFKPKLLLGKAIIAYYNFRHQEIYQLAKEALQCNMDLYQKTDIRHTSILNLMGAACYEKHYFEEAIQHYQTALKINRTSNADRVAEFHLLMNIGNAREEQNQFQLAIQSLEEALELAQKDSNLHDKIGMVYYNLGSCLYSIGYHHRAKDYAEEALRVSETLEPTPPYFSFILNLLGKCHGKLGNLSAATQYMHRNYDHLQSVYGDNYQGLPYAMNAHAAILFDQGEVKQSLAIYEDIFKLVEEQGWDPNDVDRGSYFEQAADCALVDNDTLIAVQYLQHAIQDFRHSTGSSRLQVSSAAAKLSQLYLNKGTLDSVESYLEIAHKTLLNEPTHLNFDDLVSSSEWPNFRKLGDVLAAKVDYRIAKFLRERDLSNLMKAEHEIDQLMQLSSPEVLAYFESGDLTQLIDRYISNYDLAIRYYALRYDLNGDDDLLYKALTLVEATKDMSLKIASQRSDQQQTNVVDRATLQQEEYLRSNMKRIREEMFAQDPTDSSKAQLLSDSLFSYQRKMDLFQADLATSHPRYHETTYRISAPSFQVVQAYARKERATIINFFWGKTNLYAFVLSEGEIKYQTLGKVSDLDLLIDKARDELTQFKETPSLHALYQQLLAPIEEFVKTERLVIIPDGKLHFLPFEALQTPTKTFVAEEKTIWYAHSLDHLVSGSDKDYHQNLLSLAPGFSDSLKSALYRQLGSDLVGNFTSELFQPNAIRITKSLAQTFEGTFLLESDATEHNFRVSIGNQGIIHLATHAQVDDHNPMYSRFSLVPAADDHDGFLHAYEIINLPLKAELAVLPACKTGVGKIHRGEGVTSLSYAFRASGCNNVLMSLWLIDEQQSMSLISDFYTLLKKSDSAADALAEAKRRYLKSAKGPLRNPAYWSGLVLVGNGLVRDSTPAYHWLVLVLFGLVGFSIWMIKHKSRIRI